MRYFLLLVSLLIAQTTIAQKKEMPLIVIGATSQRWVHDTSAVKSGVNYVIKTYINTDRGVSFENLWIAKENVRFDMELISVENLNLVRQGDTVILSYNRPDGSNNNNTDAKRLPIDYKGEALIECTIHGSAAYFVVKKFKELPASGR